MIEKRSLEDTLAAFDDIVRRYRRGINSPGAADSLSREEAIAQLMRLRFTTGEALRLLRSSNEK